MKKTLIVLGVIVALILIIGALIWPCGYISVSEYMADMNAAQVAWNDAARIADDTSPEALAGPLQDLEEAYNQLENISAPLCMQPSHQKLADGFGILLEGYVGYMQDSGDYESLMDQGRQLVDEAAFDIEEIRKCAPICCDW